MKHMKRCVPMMVDTSGWTAETVYSEFRGELVRIICSEDKRDMRDPHVAKAETKRG